MGEGRGAGILPAERIAALFADGGISAARPLDADAMHAAAQMILGRHDFTTFRAAACQAKSPIRTLERLDVTRVGDEIHIEASARSFLHNQVRSLVGSLVKIGHAAWPVTEMRAALDARDRARCGPVAPPDGLYFMQVDYPEGKAPFQLTP
jgi:tRNA pseudouridine38-40 synthase